MQLDDRDQQLLAFEASHWKHVGAKETAIRNVFDLSPTRYYARLNWLLDQPAALAAEPMVVRRLLRLREQRAGQRSARRLRTGS